MVDGVMTLWHCDGAVAVDTVLHTEVVVVSFYE